MNDEQYLRQRWNGLSVQKFPMGWFIHANWGEDAEVICIAGYCSTEGEAIVAAKAFTEDRERQIAEVEEEIALLESDATIPPKMQKLYEEKVWEFSKEFLRHIEVKKRILLVEQDRLKALKTGMVAK